ncbi:radical SAM protein [Oleiagrimonas sp. MCCC 1A03011]|uniref:radical SAM/SPASM domain-containing protein n=1 Tax=Oleiagrimonas sp. MCCC 1A03011 TaxID=1926883 RepID=UPI000DC4473F|nr:radical SAM protein [Oleiagrimonas sp. MCCC 1A03011]RAP59463.1 radical SAM/SPASM domain-containing protein [Oleiagrimonas sp. MCCC 1A03011]
MSTNKDVLSKSPLDRIPVVVVNEKTADAELAGKEASQRYKPSRFNVQATTTEGWLLLWNTYSGSMNAFRPSQHDAIRALISQKTSADDEKGIARYLNERGFLVPAATDELRRVQYAFGKENHRTDRLELILLTSEDCNFRCTYCYEDFRKGTMLPSVREGIKNLVRSRLGTLKELSVSWFGGEPLYGMEAIDDLGPFFTDVAEQAGLQYDSHTTTNGYLLTKEVADRLLNYQINDFQITLDGLAEDHNRHRGARDGSGTFEVIYANLCNLAARDDDFTVVIRVNFDQQNAPGLEAFLELLQERFAHDDRFILAFHAVGKWGGENDANLAVCGMDESYAVRTRLTAAARGLGLSVTGGWQPGLGAGEEVCYAARPYNFIVGAHGDLMKCTIDLDKKDYNIVGKIQEDGSLNLDVDKMALWTEPAFERDTGCQSCHMLAACQGVHCPAVRISTGDRCCPGIRRTAKQEMVAYFNAAQADEESPKHHVGSPVTERVDEAKSAAVEEAETGSVA